MLRKESKSLFRAVGSVRDVIHQEIFASTDFCTALDNAEFLGKFNWLNTDGVYGDDLLEEHLYEAFLLPLLADWKIDQRPRKCWIHLISEAYDLGGHTLLCKSLVKELHSRGYEQQIVVTRAATAGFLSEMRPFASIVLIDRDRASDKVLAVLEACVHAHTVVSHAHPDDIQASLAMRALSRTGVYIMCVNHADHVFSFGLGAADVVLEVSGFGWRLSEAKRPIKAHSFLGIPINVAKAAVPRATDRALVVSMGPGEKYAPQYGRPDFQGFLFRLLELTDCRVDIIGPTGTEFWWQRLRSRFPERITFSGPLPYSEAREKVSQASCYVDSFPMNGGTAFAEALAMGKTVFGVGVNSGYNLAQALYSESVDGLIDALASFIDGSAETSLQGELRRRIRTESSPSSVCDRLVEAANGKFCDPPHELSGSPFAIDYYVENWINQNRVHFFFHWNHSLRIRARTSIALTISKAIWVASGTHGLLRQLPGLLLFIIKKGP